MKGIGWCVKVMGWCMKVKGFHMKVIQRFVKVIMSRCVKVSLFTGKPAENLVFDVRKGSAGA